MNVLLLGSGGREHALALSLVKSPLLEKLFASPGNPGMAALAHQVALDFGNHDSIVQFCRLMSIGLVVIGPEAPLVAGIVDDLTAPGIRAFGPSKAAARLEGSKAFAKDFCRRNAIPTATYACFTDDSSAKAYVHAKGAPIVIKADGLAAGKGVTVAMSLAEAEAAIDRNLQRRSDERRGIVIEEFLEGEEVSFFALCDGAHALEFGSAQDHKRVGEGECGPNTGGMGAYSPAPFMDAQMSERVMREIIAPTLRGMSALGAPFKGVLFAGLMIGASGPKLVEFNVRFGDPETQVLVPRLQEDLLPLLLDCVDGTLREGRARFSSQTALTVVLAANGYPDAPTVGSEIHGAERAEALPSVTLTHAGTKREGQKLLAAGGRVLNVTAVGSDVAEAYARAYAAIDLIDWRGGFCRHDIGWRALKRGVKIDA